MKIIVALCSAVFLLICTEGRSQKVSFTGRDVPLEKIFMELKKQTGYGFMYTKQTLAGTKPVTVSVENVMLKEFLEMILKDQPVLYSIESRTVVISRREGEKKGMNGLIKARILDSVGRALAGATVAVKNSKVSGVTDSDGMFNMNVGEGDVLLVSYVGHETRSVVVTSSMLSSSNTSVITLRPSVTDLKDVEVVINTGYQRISPERTTGSFSTVSGELLNRRVSRNILDRIENMTTGVSFKNANDGILIRGRNSIFSNVTPLVVVDNFPYDGDIRNLNPNDVENITILKDAAAASIWGARAGNGVIVITTKRGKTNKPQVTINSNISVQQHPDLFNIPTISSAEYIDIEKFLYNQGYYSGMINDDINRPPLTPVIEILDKKDKELIGENEAEVQINALKNIDYRSDLEKYFYRNAVQAQNAVAISGNSGTVNYYLSLGWDKNLSELAGQEDNRITVTNRTGFKVSNNLQIDIKMAFAKNTIHLGNNPGYNIGAGRNISLYPYADLVDAAGNALPIVKGIRQTYMDTVGGGNLLDWSYRPYEEINRQTSKTNNNEYLISPVIRYKMFNWLQLEATYQFLGVNLSSSNVVAANSYQVRNLINSITQVTAGKYFSPFPQGAIFGKSSGATNSHQGRVQLNFNQVFQKRHIVSGLAGWEIKSVVNELESVSNVIGYNEATRTFSSAEIDYNTYFPVYYNSNQSTRIPRPGMYASQNTDRFISYFGNASYTLDDKYTLSGSVRNDAANLFGVKTNQKGVLLWSVGAAWQLGSEQFFTNSWLPFLKLRATYGINGNFSRSTHAYPTAVYMSDAIIPAVTAQLQNPPNENLRWEQVRVFNIGLDFGSAKQIVSGSVEYFTKKHKDLIGSGPADPTLGLIMGLGGGSSTFTGNLASMEGEGAEIEINTKNIDRKFKWNTTFLFSYAQNRVTEYLIPVSTNGTEYVGREGSILPIIGKPVFTMYSYAWAGLDPESGDPLGYVGKNISNDWSAINSQTKFDSLVYNGPAQAPIFGAFRNTFSWKQLSVSVNISYRTGYVFRRKSVSYFSLFQAWTAHSDFSKRWQKKGDEQYTSVPSMIYPNTNTLRDYFYSMSDVLVEKGDNIRLEDINMSYAINQSDVRWLPLRQINIYAYSSLRLLLWKANKAGIDPDFNGMPRDGKRFSIGLTATF